MAALTFNKCCCCIDLRVGCLILGYINLVINIIFTLLGLVGIVGINALKDSSEMQHATQETKDNAAAAILLTNVILAIVLVFLVLNLAFAIVLLVGIHKNKPGHVKAYCIFDAIFIVISIIIFIVQICGGSTTGGAIVQSLLSIGFSIYILLVFRSYYYKMSEGNNGAIYSA